MIILTDDSHPLNPAPPHGDLDIDSAPQPSHPKYKSLSEILSTPAEHDFPPPSPTDSSQTSLSSDGSHSPSQPVKVDPHPDLLNAGPRPVEHFVNPPLTGEYHPDLMLTAESRPPPTLRPTDNHPPPPPASPLNPGPSTEPNPAPDPGRKRPRPIDDDWGNSLREIFKGKFKRRFSGSSALDSINERSHEHSDQSLGG